MADGGVAARGEVVAIIRCSNNHTSRNVCRKKCVEVQWSEKRGGAATAWTVHGKSPSVEAALGAEKKSGLRPREEREHYMMNWLFFSRLKEFF